jgi:hypothetical protein
MPLRASIRPTRKLPGRLRRLALLARPCQSADRVQLAPRWRDHRFRACLISIQHLVFAVVCGVPTAVAFRLAQGILRGLGITSGAGALNRRLGGVPQWMLGGAFMGALVGAGFMVWLDGMAADIVAPAMAAAPVGAVAGWVIRGLTLLLAGGRRA